LNHTRFTPESRLALAHNCPLLLWNAFCLAVWCEMGVGLGAEELRALLVSGARGSPPHATRAATTAATSNTS
jgi:hypothetical protein